MTSEAAAADPSEILTSLPSALAAASDREVLQVAASAVASLYPSLGYIRVLLVSQNYQTSQVLELCSDPRMGPLLAEASNAHNSSGGGGSSSGISGGGPAAAAAAAAASSEGGGRWQHSSSSSSSSNSQQAAMRRGVPVYTPQLQQWEDGQAGPNDFTDWRVLQQQFGQHSFAAVPVMMAGTVHGCILAAAAEAHTFDANTLHLIRTVANMLAPYAAVLYKFQQIQSTRLLLQQLLPPRVVAAAIDRLSIGGSGLVDAFGPTHVDLQPGPGG